MFFDFNGLVETKFIFLLFIKNSSLCSYLSMILNLDFYQNSLCKAFYLLAAMENLGIANFNRNPTGADVDKISLDVFVNEA